MKLANAFDRISEDQRTIPSVLKSLNCSNQAVAYAPSLGRETLTRENINLGINSAPIHSLNWFFLIRSRENT